MIKKSLKDISWLVGENEYRKDNAISYSKLSAFDRKGHREIPHLDDKQDSEALRFGSLVDCLITEPDTLADRFLIIDYSPPTEAISKIIKDIFNTVGTEVVELEEVDRSLVFKCIQSAEYQPGWKEDTRVNKVIEQGAEYYKILQLGEIKTLITQQVYNNAVQCVDTLKSSLVTKDYFNYNPFTDAGIEKLFQLKFRSDTVSQYGAVRCMFDLIIVDHNNKTIRPNDLKTTGKDEHEFYKSFIDWKYYLQGTMYTAILQDVISKDEYFKDFTILPYEFIVINKYTQTPLVWIFEDNFHVGDFITKDGVECKGWERLLKELNWHLETGKMDYSYDAYMSNGVMQLNTFK